jgi:peptidoglycan/xylan/chitin deacetylase (PgdA/CDA1 family)
MKYKKNCFLIFILMLTLATVACSTDKLTSEETPSYNYEEETQKTLEEKEPVDPKELIDLSLNPNEAGEVMIIMYHNIGEEEAEWQRTPENFKKDLKVLYDKGYRPVTLKDYVTNNMDIEAGYTPVVLTFDDGNENNFRIIKNDKGENIIDPKSAIGLLEDFSKEYPDFKSTATFFIFGTNPFRQEEYIDYKLNYLIEKGYDIGNHTIDHRSMKKMDTPKDIQEAIGKQVEVINRILPQYEIDTYALCYGERPKNKDLETYLQKGKYNDTIYENIAILNVGWNPAPSPISKKFNPLSLPRIRGSQMKVDNVGLYNWLEYFDKNPERKYISDGNKNIVTIPSGLEDSIEEDKLNGKELYIYNGK